MLANSASQSSLNSLGKQLLEASRHGNDNEVRMLMTQGAPFTSDWLGTSPLHLACMNGHVSTAQILARAGVSWDGRTKADKTPMHFAAQYGHHEVVAVLLKLGASINSVDMLNMTPVHWAVIEEHFLVVKLLVEHNADLTIKNKFDKTPIESAQDACNFHIVEYLKSSLNHPTYEDPVQSTSSVTDTPPHTVLASLAALSGSSTITDSLPWLHQDSVASGASVLLEGANMITLTEAGKLALQTWSNIYEDESAKDADVESQQENESGIIVTPDSTQKVLSITLANQMLNTSPPGFGTANQPIKLVVSQQSAKSKQNDSKQQSNKRKRRLSNSEQKSVELELNSINNHKELQRQLAAAQSEVALYREKLQMKEQEAHLWKKRLEVFHQSRT